jgi:hypothetical protein
MSSWLIGLALALVLAALALSYLWLVRRNETENAEGLRALAGLRWREFSTLVGQAMQRRGLRHAEREIADENPADGGAQMLMTDGSGRWLLTCKHGMAYQIQSSHVEELAGEMDLAGARSGMLLTEGKADRGAFAAAQSRHIEIIDGRRLWTLLKPFMPADSVDRIESGARAQAKRHSLIAVLAAITLGALAGLAWPGSSGESAPPAAPAAAAGSPRAATASTAAGSEASQAPAAEVEPELEPGIVADPDAVTLARYRVDITRTLSRSPGITRAYWLTQTTLVIDRVGTDTGVWPQVCAELVRYPSLRTVRVQLNPRPDVDEPVRWRQCRTS